MAPKCSSLREAAATGLGRAEAITCSCTREAVVRGLDGNPHGGCVPPRE